MNNLHKKQHKQFDKMGGAIIAEKNLLNFNMLEQQKQNINLAPNLLIIVIGAEGAGNVELSPYSLSSVWGRRKWLVNQPFEIDRLPTIRN